MVKLKTDKALLGSSLKRFMAFKHKFVGQCIHDALAAHEMKPEYDRMKAELEEAKNWKIKTVVTGYHINGKSFVPEEQLKAALERGKELESIICAVQDVSGTALHNGADRSKDEWSMFMYKVNDIATGLKALTETKEK